MNILDCIPKDSAPRDWQISPLLEVQENWDKADVFVIPGPVAFGKSYVAMVIANWNKVHGRSTALITPRVLLQDQYNKSFPDVPILKGKARYMCKREKNVSCQDMAEISMGCKDCAFTQAREATNKSKIAIYNLASYYFAPDSKDVVIVDEAHLISDWVADSFSLHLWKHIEHYPKGLNTIGDICIWLEKEIKALKAVKSLQESVEDKLKRERLTSKYERVKRGLEGSPATFFIEHTNEMYYGKLKECLKVRPQTVKQLPPMLWDYKTKKIILMSATLSEEEISQLNLFGKRIHWVTTTNPIPADRRPIVVEGAVNMGFKYQTKNAPVLAAKIDELAQRHSEKGIVHVTYQVAEVLQTLLKGDRYLFHTTQNKEQMLNEFLNSSDKILIACGMSEGLDLAGETYTWQVIGKIMYPNKSDKLIEYWYDKRNSWITWLTVRTLLQQVGRICRSPEDYGVTYILDSNFGNLVHNRLGLVGQAKKLNMLSKDFLESVNWDL